MVKNELDNFVWLQLSWDLIKILSRILKGGKNNILFVMLKFFCLNQTFFVVVKKKYASLNISDISMNNFLYFEKVNFMISKISQTPKKRMENHVFKKNLRTFCVHI